MAQANLRVAPSQLVRRAAAGAVLAAAMFSLAGCGWLMSAEERQYGKAVEGEYKGLTNHSAVIVVYVPEAILNEYTQAARELTEFVREQLRTVDVRLVETQTVLNWQAQNPNWNKLMDRQIAEHFSVDRVLYIELVEYSTKDPGIEGYVRGRISTSARVFEVEKPGNAPAWGPKRIGAVWPETGPADMMRNSETLARRQTLIQYARTLANAFRDHRQLRPAMNEVRF